MTKEEILKDDWVANNYGDRARNWVDPAFIDGVEWMQEKMIEKAAEWLYIYYPTLERSKSFKDAWEHFKKAMQDERKDI